MISLTTIENAAMQTARIAVERIANMPFDRQSGDFEKDGILYCGKCGEARQAWIEWFPDEDGNQQKKLVRVMCRCDFEKEQREKDIQAEADFRDAMRRINLALQPNALELNINCSGCLSGNGITNGIDRKYLFYQVCGFRKHHQESPQSVYPVQVTSCAFCSS